jgi:hypothetical protein
VPAFRIHALLTPDRGRWQPMLMGLAIAAAAAGAAAAFNPSRPVEALLIVLALVAWYAGACAMVGYVRWFFASELVRAARERAEAEKEKGESR